MIFATIASPVWAAPPGPAVGPEFQVEAPLSAGANSDYPDVTWNGSAFVVLYGGGVPGQSMGFSASKVNPVDASKSPPGVGVVSGAIGRARIASNGPEHLVVWAEAGDIKAVRLDSSGTLSVGTPFVVSSASGDQSEPAVAANGSEFLVTWTDTRSGNADVFGARVDASGLVYDPNGIPIFVGADEQSAPSVAWDGFQYVVVGRSSSVLVARVSSSGALLGNLTAPGSIGGQSPTVAASPTNSLIVWSHGAPRTPANGVWPDIRGVRLPKTGNFIESTPIAVVAPPSPNDYYRAVSTIRLGPLAVAWTGSEYQVIFEQWGDYNTCDTCSGLWVAPVGADGKTPQYSAAPGGPLLEDEYSQIASIGCGGGKCFTAYNAERLVMHYVLQGDGWFGGGVNRQERLVAANDGTKYFLAWWDTRPFASPPWWRRCGASPYNSPPFQCDTYTLELSPSGAPLQSPVNVGPHEVSGVPHLGVAHGPGFRVSNKSIASNGSGFLEVWWELFTGEVRASRLDASGAPLDPAPIVVATGIPYVSVLDENRWTPAVSWGGSSYLVVWRNGSALMAARVTPNGSLLDPAGIRLPNSVEPSVGDRYENPEEFRLSWDGTAHLVVWVEHSGDAAADPWWVKGARVAGDGAVLDPTGFLIARTNGHYRAAVSWDGVHHLVAFNTASGVNAVRVSRSGTLEGEVRVGDGHSPDITSFADGTALVAYNSSAGGIRARFLLDSCDCDGSLCASACASSDAGSDAADASSDGAPPLDAEPDASSAAEDASTLSDSSSGPRGDAADAGSGISNRADASDEDARATAKRAAAPSDDSGCSFARPRTSSTFAPAATLLLALLALRNRRRRRRETSAARPEFVPG